MADSPKFPGTPRWVKMAGAVTICLALLLAAIIFFTDVGGSHGPGRHMPSVSGNDVFPEDR